VAFLLVGFLTLIALVTAQVTAGFYFQDRLGLSVEGAAQAVGLALFASGVTIVIAQAGIIRALKPPRSRCSGSGCP
jgi:hypothetical protein